MKRQYILASAVSEVPISISADHLDVPKWLFSLSDVEYQKCAKGHFGAGTSILPDGKRISVNVESVGGHLAVQHYVEEISKPDHLKLVSVKSDAWIYHFIHFHPTVSWEIKLIPDSEHSCIFQDNVSIEHTNLFVKLASVLCFFQFFAKKHDDEETKLFAESLLRTA